MEISFRPHHFLCALCFEGKGYSPTFISNFQTIMDTLSAPNGDEVEIAIVGDTDSICSPCPNRRDKLCTTQDKIAALDHAHAQALAINPGTTITWKEAKSRIAEKISLDTFHVICQNCEWKKLGICEKKLAEFSKF